MDAESDPPFARFAVRFATALAASDFDAAHALLGSALKASVTPERLARDYADMIEYGEGPATTVRLVNTMEDWTGRGPQDLGWAYVAISGEEFDEAIVAVVAQEAAGMVVRQLEWGRP